VTVALAIVAGFVVCALNVANGARGRGSREADHDHADEDPAQVASRFLDDVGLGTHLRSSPLASRWSSLIHRGKPLLPHPKNEKATDGIAA